LARIRHMYPGGNTCQGFHSFYDHIVPHNADNKIILKGGPGVGKSTFMKKIASDLIENGVDIEYHWCSSDNNSLDGVVAGDRQVCILDGTAPHVVDPRYPGAVDRIINLGDFWDSSLIAGNKKEIIELTNQISMQFSRAYNRLKETYSAWWEWSSYYLSATDSRAANRNILALADDFIRNAPKSEQMPRHLFAAALTPEGIVNKAESLIDENWAFYAVKGSPGSGIKNLFKHIEQLVVLNSIRAEIYHCPFDPSSLDLIILPENKAAILDISSHVTDYKANLPVRKYKRMLDFDQFVDSTAIKPYSQLISAAKHRFQTGLQEAIAFIHSAKAIHDVLESKYVPAMDFDHLEELRKELSGKLLIELKR
jgi:hypothetical protein